MKIPLSNRPQTAGPVSFWVACCANPFACPTVLAMAIKLTPEPLSIPNGDRNTMPSPEPSILKRSEPTISMASAIDPKRKRTGTVLPMDHRPAMN